MQTELTIKVVRAGKEINEKRTLEQVVKALAELELKERLIPYMVNDLLAKFPAMRTFNLKAIVHRMGESTKLPSLKSAKQEVMAEYQAWVREYFKDNSDMFDLRDKGIVYVIRNMNDSERADMIIRRAKEAKEAFAKE